MSFFDESMSARTEQPLTAVLLEECRLTPTPCPTLAFMKQKKDKKAKLLATIPKFDEDGSLSDDKIATTIETIRDEAKTRWPSLASAAGASPLDNVVVTTASRFTGEVYKHSFHIIFAEIGFSSNSGELKNFATHLKKLDNMQAKNAETQPTSLIDTNVYNKD
jgi:hypothetical protein